MELDLWRIFTSLGIPGVIFGVFYMLFRKLNFKFSVVPRSWAGPIVVLFLLIIGGVTFYSLMLWAPAKAIEVNTVAIVKEGKSMEQLADAGDEVQQYLLALSYENALNEYEKDIDNAIYWYSQSAANGYKASTDALNRLIKKPPAYE